MFVILLTGEGPIGVIVAPTRELAEQIHRECRRFGKAYGLRMCAAFGGLSKLDQFRDLKGGSEVGRPLAGQHAVPLGRLHGLHTLHAPLLTFC